MARATKKKKELTIEEKLAEALVPVEKQPYKVPENWCWVYHNSILDISGGSQPAKSYFISECKEGYIQLYQTRDYGEHPVPVFIPEKYATKTTDEGDILLARYGGSLGKVFRAHKGAYNVALAKIIKLFPSILNDEYLYQYYLSHFYQEFCIKAASGRSAQSGFNRNDMEDLLFPLPPLPEQQRIVDRIESLFAKLDEAKEKAQAVVDGFEDRKAAILHKAFTGELTKEWRDTHGLSIDEWEHAPLNTVFQLRSGSTIDISEEREYGAIPYVKVADMNLPENEIQITTSSRFVDSCPESHVIPEGSTIFPKRGGAILTNKKRYVGINKIIADLNTMAIMPIEGKAYGWYGYYWMQSVDLRQLNNGSNVPQINNKDMVKLFVPKPSIIEQKIIVSILDSVFEKEQQAKEAAEQVISQIDTMKKSILARAFRGELGTNDPTDESAIELLKRVL